MVYMIIQTVYLIELNYDWNDSWYENYLQQNYSKTWAFWLIFFSALCWVLDVWMIFANYDSEYFYAFIASFVFSLVLTVISSSALTENGCNI